MGLLEPDDQGGTEDESLGNLTDRAFLPLHGIEDGSPEIPGIGEHGPPPHQDLTLRGSVVPPFGLGTRSLSRRSRPSRARLARPEEMIPPCGVPSSVGWKTCFSIYPAFSHFRSITLSMGTGLSSQSWLRICPKSPPKAPEGRPDVARGVSPWGEKLYDHAIPRAPPQPRATPGVGAGRAQ
jgi:hypothetical protein